MNVIPTSVRCNRCQSTEMSIAVGEDLYRDVLKLRDSRDELADLVAKGIEGLDRASKQLTALHDLIKAIGTFSFSSSAPIKRPSFGTLLEWNLLLSRMEEKS